MLFSCDGYMACKQKCKLGPAVAAVLHALEASWNDITVPAISMFEPSFMLRLL